MHTNKITFQDISLSESLSQGISEIGFVYLTEIQEKAIEPILQGHDLIGQAQTGTGKTAAFAIPLIERLEAKPLTTLILAPTRELAIQIEQEINKIGKYTTHHALAIYGGQPIDWQIKALKKKPSIIVATPGRLMDHMRRRTIRTENIQAIVLDEADEMLNMGFIEDIEAILSACPTQRQTLMFSATMRKEIEEIAQKFMRTPLLVSVEKKQQTVESITQGAFVVEEVDKLSLLIRVLDIHLPELTVIFGRTKRRVDELAKALQKLGYRADGLHGDLNQTQRDRVMSRFRNKQLEILVTTDVAARGIDVSGIDLVVNFDLPQEADSYVHRVGRTGRAGRGGTAFSFVEIREKNHFSDIEKSIGQRITRLPFPSGKLVQQAQKDHIFQKIQNNISLENKKFESMVSELLELYPADILVQALLEELPFYLDRSKKAKKIDLTPERPLGSTLKKRSYKPHGRSQKMTRPHKRRARKDTKNR